MKILILGSISLPIPPPFSGGTERIAYEQALGAARNGHRVMLVGGRGSQKSKVKSQKFELIEVVGSSMDYGWDPKTMESSRKLRVENALLAEVMGLLSNRRNDYDLVINNLRGGEAVLLPLMKLLKKPMVNVLHLPLFDELVKIFRQFQAPLVSISNSQRGKWPGLNWLGTVYNGIDIDKFKVQSSKFKVKKEYLLNIGTIGEHKGQAAAVEVARRTRMKLVLAGKIRDADYFEKYIQPAVDHGQVQYYGELDFKKKLKLYQEALCFLFPIQWNEPFGLVMIEAMSCGTPVIAFDRGSVAEVVKDGETGYIINPKSKIRNPKSEIRNNIQNANDQNSKRFEHLNLENSNLFRISNFDIRISGIEGMVAAVNKLKMKKTPRLRSVSFALQNEKLKIKMRKACRKWVEEKFTKEKMVEGYLRVIEKLSN